MSVVSAAVLPHSPLLLPTVAKDHAPLLQKTVDEIQLLVAEQYAAKPDVVIILTPHSVSYPGTFVVSSAEQYQGEFGEFGDFQTKVTVAGVPGVAHRCKMAAEEHRLPLLLQTLPTLDYGCSVPQWYFQSASLSVPILPIAVSGQSNELLLRLGDMLHDFCTGSNTRFSIIASADFSRRHDRSLSAHHRPTSEERLVSNAITTVDSAAVLAGEPKADTCGYAPTLVLLSAMHRLASRGTIRSFEAPLGVGLLTATFHLGHGLR